MIECIITIVTTLAATNRGRSNMDLTVKDAATKLGISERTVRLWISQNKFPHAYHLDPDTPNSPYRIPEQDIQAIIDRRKGN